MTVLSNLAKNNTWCAGHPLSLWDGLGLPENGVVSMIRCRHSREVSAYPRLKCLTIFSRPSGTSLAGTCTQHCVLGYFQPSLRDWFRYFLMTALFSACADQIGPVDKANLDKSQSMMRREIDLTCV
jgi:hypothetical protein